MSFEQLERTVQVIVKIFYTYDLGPKWTNSIKD